MVKSIDLGALVDRPVEEARRLVEQQGYEFRVLIEDGNSPFVTADYRVDRVNVEVAGGKVVRADIG
jgi:hypothetical protein